MPLPQKTYYTIDDIYALPEGQRAELIDGKLYMMAPPSTRHQIISGWLFNQIYNFIQNNQGKCNVFNAPFAVYLAADDEKYFEPDISVICDPDKIDDKGCQGAPDWIIEIVSPASRTMDYYIKLSEYKKAGVKEYWIVDPTKKIVMVYNLRDEEPPIIYPFSAKITPLLYQNLEIDFSKLNI